MTETPIESDDGENPFLSLLWQTPDVGGAERAWEGFLRKRLGDPVPTAAELYGSFLAETSCAEERIAALRSLRLVSRGEIPNVFVDGILGILCGSPDASFRAGICNSLRGAREPRIQERLRCLAQWDADVEVRAAARGALWNEHRSVRE